MAWFRLPFLLAALLLLPCRAAVAQDGSDGPSTRPAATAERVAVLGASMSAGFDLLRVYGARIDLSDVLRAALGEGRWDVENLANTLLFTDPLRLGARQVDQAREFRPTLVVALDFPFWFGYGDGMEDDQRLELLEKGLAMLEGFDAPVVVGDFPDMRAATVVPSARGAPMLSPGQVPSPAALQRLNERLREWAAEERSRVVVGLDGFHRALAGGGEVAVRGNAWRGGDLESLLIEDRLHPSVEGSIALVLCCLDALVAAGAGVPEEAVVWDAQAVRARLDEATREERRRNLERERRREVREGTTSGS